jgi:hypothetical protein
MYQTGQSGLVWSDNDRPLRSKPDAWVHTVVLSPEGLTASPYGGIASRG